MYQCVCLCVQVQALRNYSRPSLVGLTPYLARIGLCVAEMCKCRFVCLWAAEMCKCRFFVFVCSRDVQL